MDLEDWRSLIEHWRSHDKDLRHLEIPPDIAKQLGIELPKEMDTMTDESTESTTTQEPPLGGKWKKKKYFDGTVCGLIKCTKKPDGYIADTKPTKGADGQLWYGPACTACVRKTHETLNPLTLAKLAYQRDGASDLAMVLDIEVGELKKRLEAEGIDEQGRYFAPDDDTPEPSTDVVVAADQTPGDALDTLDETAVVTVEAVAIPITTLKEAHQEAAGVLGFLNTFYVVDQTTMDMAGGFLNGWVDGEGNKQEGVKSRRNVLEEARKALGKPLRDKLAEVQVYFKPVLDTLAAAEVILKQKISDGNLLAQQQQQAALAAAQTAHQAGNVQGTALASQQVAAYDVSLPQGVTQRMVTKFKIVDQNALPGQFWTPDPAKIQAAIDAGFMEIPGVQIWAEPSLAATPS